MDGAGSGGGTHLDEGTIHAWLDDALDAPEAARVASHVASCAQCAAAVAEARGLIAGASRVVRALDDDTTAAAAPVPAWGSASAASAPRSRWSMLRVTPTRAAIAASLIVALGVTLTYPRSAPQESALLQTHTSSIAATDTAVVPNDHLLDSAIKRNVAAAQPPRAMEAASSPAVPQAPPATAGAVAAFVPGASAKVAAGRMATQAMRDTSAPEADQLRALGNVPVAKDVVTADAAAPAAAEAVKKTVARRMAPTAQIPVTRDVDSRERAVAAAECYRVESSVANASWGPQRLPFTVTLRPDSANQRGLGVIAGAANPESSNASLIWSRQAGDTLHFRLRRLGYTGEVVLAAGSEERLGTMRSAPMTNQLSEVVTTGYGTQVDSVSGGERRTKARALRREDSAATLAPASAAAQGIPVVARRISCEP